jgi:hypothetical protein
MDCKFCFKECKNLNSQKNHERLCKLNPNRQFTPFHDKEKQKEILKIKQLTNRKNQWSNKNYIISENTKKKHSEYLKNRNANESKEDKKNRIMKLSSTITKKVEEGTWHTSVSKNMHYNYRGINLHGSWELKYAKWLDENSIAWIRCKESFEYEYQGKRRRYTPDFYLPETDEYIEIKGYKTEKDDAKWSQFPSYRKLKILMAKDLKYIGVI